jgi:hypothetical protein
MLAPDDPWLDVCPDADALDLPPPQSPIPW